MSEQPLSAIKVVELAEYVTGPYTGKFFADLGAEVIKVEEPSVGDLSRKEGPFPSDVPDPERSGQFLYLNTNKLGITLDVKTATGRDILKQLLTDADLFVHDRPPMFMKTLGLDYESLKELNRRLVMTSISPFGQTGPYRDYKAYDINISAAAGVTHRQGRPGREPLSMPAYQASYFAGVCAAGATMCALYARDIGGSGMGQHVDVSQEGALIAVTGLSMGATVIRQQVAGRLGHRIAVIWPYAALPVKDGVFYICSLTEQHWQTWVKVMGDPEWARDPRYETQYKRGAVPDEMERLVEPWLMSHTKAEFEQLCREHHLPWKPMQTIEELFEHDQLKARDFFIEVDHPKAGRLRYPGSPVKCSTMRWKIKSPAPLLGQHNEEVFCHRLGYTKQDLVNMSRTGII